MSSNKLRSIELILDGSYELHKAEHEDFGTVFFEKLCIRHMEEENIQMFREEAEIPMRLSHQNVIKFLDIILVNAENGLPGMHGLVYEYLDFGDLNDFLDMFPLEWSYKLSLLYDVASGMNYLHARKPPIIHGDLRTEHVLIGYDFKAKVSDFCFAKWKSYSLSHSKRKVGYETVAHYPPESISNSGSAVAEKSKQFDVYSFGILFWETIAQQKPFLISNTTIVSNWILNGKRPDETLISGDVTPACTSLMKACWSENVADRPSFNEIESKLQGELALMNVTNILSESLKEMSPLPEGGYFDSFKACHPNMGVVVYKELSISTETEVSRLKSEATSLLHLNHPNLVKLMSIVTDKNGTLGIVYPFHDDGNLHTYLRKTNLPWLNRLSLLHDVACGMCFLHRQTPAIIHGDLKIKNVLVSIVREIPIAKICDFGLPEWKMCSNSGSSVDGVQLGSLFITPPECLNDPDLPKTVFYDVYSFGILMYQTMTLERPYTELKTGLLTDLVERGKRPALDKIPTSLGVSQASSELMQRCWRSNAADRSDFQTITGDLRKEIQSLRLENKDIKKIQHSELNGLKRKERFDGYFSVVTIDHAELGTVTIKKPYVKAIKFRDAIRLLNDASSYQRFDHRNILKMHALAQYEDGNIEVMPSIQSRIYGIVFEHAGDHSLNEYLRVNNLSWDQKLPLVCDVASGMAYLHSLTPEVTHGDLRIENVFIREDGGSVIAKVCNFGFPLAFERKPPGTIVHIPPENLKTPHHPISEAFDVYSFAVLLWQTMTTKQMQPLSKEAGQSGKTIYELVLLDVRPDLNCISSDVPQTSMDLMKRCWSTSKADRPIFKGIVEELDTELKSIQHTINIKVSDQ